MATLARKFTAVSDNIAISYSGTPAGVPNLVFHFAFKLDAGSTAIGSGNIRYMMLCGSVHPNFVTFYADKDFAFGGGPQAFNYFVAYAANDSGAQVFRTAFDPLAGMAGDGLWHYLTIEWSEWDISANSNAGMAILTIDGVSYNSTDSMTMFPRTNGNSLISGGLPSLSDGVYFGDGNSLVGMSVSNIGVWQYTDFFRPTTLFTYTGTYNDITSLAAGIPAEVIEIDTQVDVFPITGANPELGVLGHMSAAITGTSVVSGPDLGPPVSVVATPRFSGVGHTPGSVTVDFKWLNYVPLSGGVVLDCVPSIGSMVAPSVTLTDGSHDTVSATINIPGSTPTINYSLDVTNSSGIRSISIPFSVSEPTVEVDSTTGAKVLSNGNVIVFFPKKISDGTPLAISAFSLVGSTVAINGGTPIPLDNAIPAFTGAGGVTNCWTLPKIQNSTQYRLDVDSTKSGPWSTTTQQSWIGGNFGVGTGGSGSTGYSTDPTATAVDTLTVIPGRLYSLYRVQRDIYPNNCTTVGGPATSHAQYRVLDGGVTTDHADDQTVQGSFNGTRFLYRLTKVFTQRAVTNTWEITLSNAAGANTLYSNGLVLLLEEERFSVLTDTVVVNLADNAITTPFGSTSPATITCIMETAESQSPFNPTLPRRLSVGFNTRYLNTNKFGSMFANLIKESLGFSGSPFTYDSNFGLNSIASGGTIACDYVQNGTFFSSAYGNSHDYWGNVGTTPITPTARFTLPTGADPTIFFQVSNIGYTPAGYAYGPGNLDGQEMDNGGSPITFTQRTLTYNQAPGYAQPWTMWIKSNGGTSDVPQDLWVGDVNTPPDWTRMVHPTMYDRMHGRFPGGYLRWVLSLEILQSGIYEWDQQHSPDDAIYGATSYTVGGPITAIGPVSAGAETDMANAIFGHNANRMVIKVTSPGHKFVTAILIDFQNIDWSGVVDTNGGSVDISACPIWIIRLDDDHFIAQIGSTSSSTVNNPTTLTGAMTLGGGETCYGYLGQNAMPIQDAVVMCSELLMNLWLQLPSLASDDMANKAGQCLATYLALGLKCGLEFSNERWNNFTREWNAQNFLYAANQYLYNSTGGAQGYPCTSAAMWGSLRNNQLAMQLNAGFTGVPEVRVEGYGQGATATATIAGGVVSAITLVNGGTGYTSVPTVHIMGGSGTGATATATIDGSGHVTGFTITNPGSGYVSTDRDTADVYPIFATFAFDNVNIPALADAALAYNFQVPYIALTTYVNNQPLTGDYVAAMGGYNISTIFDQCSVGDLADLFAMHFRYDDWSGATSNQIAYLESRGITGTQLLIYEGSVSIACPYGSDGVDMVRRAQEVVTHPSMYHTWLSMFQVFDHKHGIKALTYFTYNDPSGMNGNSQWQTFLSDSQPVGTGNPNEWLTPWDLSTVPSQIGGAQRFYSSPIPTIITQQVIPTTMAAMAAM